MWVGVARDAYSASEYGYTVIPSSNSQVEAPRERVARHWWVRRVCMGTPVQRDRTVRLSLHWERAEWGGPGGRRLTLRRGAHRHALHRAGWDPGLTAIDVRHVTHRNAHPPRCTIRIQRLTRYCTEYTRYSSSRSSLGFRFGFHNCTPVYSA